MVNVETRLRKKGDGRGENRPFEVNEEHRKSWTGDEE